MVFPWISWVSKGEVSLNQLQDSRRAGWGACYGAWRMAFSGKQRSIIDRINQE
jgi:hypothetical protein